MKTVKAENLKDKKIMTVDDVPDISNRILDLDTVLSWMDKLVEVNENAKNTSDN